MKIWFNIHLPLLRAIGLNRKLKLGPWSTPLHARAARLRRLRGTWLDPFGYAKVRRVYALVGEYEQMIDEALERLTPATHATAVELCELPR